MSFQQSKLQKIGPLQALILGDEGASTTVVLLHGYGANAYDLASLGDELKLGSKVRFVFPQGHLSVPIGPMMAGNAWFPIDMVAHERAALTGQPVDYSQVRPKGMDVAQGHILNLLKALNVRVEDLILGGFSQGAMLSVDTALELPIRPKGLLILSGVLVDRARVSGEGEKHKGLKYFQSHGSLDPILPFSGAIQLSETLDQAGWNGSLYEFKGGHEIPGAVIREMTSFIKDL